MTPFAVGLKREPGNFHDENAIKVLIVDEKLAAMRALHIGYVRKEIAKFLAPALDKGDVEIETAQIVELDAEYGLGQMEMDVKLYGKVDFGNWRG
jgi:hypothetical protein